VEIPFGSILFWEYSLICIGLVLFAGIASGLTVGLLSIDPLSLSILKIDGSEEEKKQAEKVEPILKNHHLLLVTLLLANSTAMEALPIFLDKLVPAYLAIILSVGFVLIFGEVLPQVVLPHLF
jgi:metal transporter CNNM